MSLIVVLAEELALGYWLKNIIAVLKTLIQYPQQEGRGDRHWNRRVRSVGEMTKINLIVGLVRVERAVKERLSLAESENLMPQDLILNLFRGNQIFGSITYVMDQNNPFIRNHA